jgi:broad specificity phosphatase PhoE
MRLIHYCVLIVFLLSLTACSSTTYYVVRHGEKQDQTDNPPLSDDGIRRAKILAHVLSDKNIGRIYVSDKQRTQQTAAPTAALFNLDPIIIPQTDTDQLILDLRNVNGANVLVVRHGEEIHLIVNALSPSDTIAPISNEFNNLFVITKTVILGQTQTRLARLRYGAP